MHQKYSYYFKQPSDQFGQTSILHQSGVVLSIILQALLHQFNEVPFQKSHCSVGEFKTQSQQYQPPQELELGARWTTSSGTSSSSLN